jgi:hypothetical protein
MKEDKLGIQMELQIRKDERLWIRLQAPLEMTEMDFRIPFYSHEEEEREEGGKKEQECKYLQCNWDTHIESKLVRIFYPSLEIRAKFTSFIFLKPRPPNSLGKQRESQALRERFFFLRARNPHQKFLKILSNS